MGKRLQAEPQAEARADDGRHATPRDASPGGVRTHVLPEIGEPGRFIEERARLVYAAIERTLRALSVPRDEDTIEDLFAAVFVAMFEDDARRLRQWDGRCSFETWVTLIATSVTRDHARRERRFEARLARDQDPVREPEGMETVYDRGPDRRRLVGALRELPQGDRRLIEALFLEERAPNEVALELGVTMGALYTRKSRALERLRDIMLGAERGDGV